MNKTNPIRRLVAVFLLLMLVFPLCAQEKADSVFSFRFFPKKNMFYVPFISNGNELNKLFDCVEQYKDVIKSNKGCVHVNGYCNSRPSTKENLAVAKIRSNRVKSELITRRGLTEDCFTTRNHSDDGDYVLVSIVLPKDSVEKYSQELSPTPVEEVTPPVEEEIIDMDVEEVIPEEPVVEEPAVDVVQPREWYRPDSRFALKTNLLDYAILMPNIELEWMFVDRWSVALELQGAWYAKNEPHKVYRIETLIPEFRYWVIDRKRWHGMYVGLFGGGGWYDLCNGKKGHEGEGGLVGVSAGYMWPISKHLSLDAELGVGYMRLHDKEYLPFDGHYLHQITKNINYFGPLRLKLSLVWRIPGKKRELVK